MKAILLIAILVSSASVNAQSLKELLYGGKLKMDSGAVIRKTDDLSTKIDTTTKKPVVAEVEIVKAPVVVFSDTTMIDNATKRDSAVAISAAATKDNNVIWKEFIDELTTTLRSEVMSSKKIKEGTYSILLEYEIGVDGHITATNISAAPESSYLEQQIKERITLSAPQMTPLLGANGKPRKALKKQTIILTK